MQPLCSLQLLPHSLAVLAEKRDLGDEFKAHVQKFLPVLRYPLFVLKASADWLEGLINGSLQPEPLLDVSAPFAKC